MTVIQSKSGDKMHCLTEQEGRALFEQECQAKLGIPAREFLRRLRAGEYDRPEFDTPDIVMLAVSAQGYSALRAHNHLATRRARPSRRASR